MVRRWHVPRSSTHVCGKSGGNKLQNHHFLQYKSKYFFQTGICLKVRKYASESVKIIRNSILYKQIIFVIFVAFYKGIWRKGSLTMDEHVLLVRKKVQLWKSAFKLPNCIRMSHEDPNKPLRRMITNLIKRYPCFVHILKKFSTLHKAMKFLLILTTQIIL